MTAFGTIAVYGSPELVNLAGLEGLTSLFSLDVSANESLTSLTGLENLRTVGSLLVGGNANLTSLSALESLMRVDGYFQVTDNPRLPTCEVYALHDVTGGEPTLVYGNQDPTDCP
jgi:hypothetical protein